MDLFKLMGTIAVDTADADKAIDSTTQKAEDAGSRQSGAFSKVTGAAKTVAGAVVGFGAAAVGVAGSMIGLSTSTEDYAVQQGKLTTAFETTGKTAQQAQATYSDLNAIMGDSDAAVEAAGNLAQLCTSQQDLSKWTNVAAGVFATFGDGLPIEGLAEAANETARCGTVTGSMADALNWTSASMDTWNAALSGNSAAQAAFNSAIEQGMTKEDAFNAALAACNDEQERAQLVTDTLNGLYSEAGQKYQEMNADLLESRKAQDAWNSVIGEAGAAVRPFATALMQVGTSIVQGVMPYLSQFADWASSALPVVVSAFQGFGGVVGSVFGTVQSVLGPVIEQVGGFFSNFGTALASTIGTFQAFTEPTQVFADGMWRIATVGETVTSFLDMLGTKLGISNDAFYVLGESIGTLVDTGFNLLQTTIAAIQPYIDPLVLAFQNLGTILSTTLVPFVMSLVSTFTSLASMIGSILTPVISTLLPIVMQLATMFVNFATQVAAVVIPAFTNIFNTVSQIVTALTPIVTAAMNAIMSVVNAVWPHIQSIIQGVMTVIQSVISTVMGVIQGIITTVMGIISGDWSAVWSGISQIASSIWNGIQGVISGAIQAVSGVISGVLATIQSVWNSCWNAVSSFISGAWDGIVNAVSGGIDSVLSFVSSLPGNILSAIGNLGSLLVSAGRDLIQGLINGITGMIGNAVNAVKDGVGKIINGAKSLLGIHSPSTVFREIGQYTIQGASVGFEKETPRAVDAMTRSMDEVVEAGSGYAVQAPNIQAQASQQASQASNDALLYHISRLYDLMANYMPQLITATARPVVLDTGELVGGMAYAMDEQLGNISRRRGRGQ